ncbi:MAG: hydrogenase maturation protease [Chloroflexota bacterium]|nr:MAG: hydrogenase maturation protease [Chloroflexota bacterium]
MRKESTEKLIIGVGNAFRGDDGVGLIVAQRLRELTLPGVTVLEQSGEGAALVESWEDAGRVIVVDAVSSGSEPGKIHRFEAAGRPLPALFSGGSTHAFGLAEAVELARQLNRLPPSLVIYGIEGKSFDLGTGLSPEVESAVEILTERIAREL